MNSSEKRDRRQKENIPTSGVSLGAKLPCLSVCKRKSGHEVESKQSGLYMRFSREEGKREMMKSCYNLKKVTYGFSTSKQKTDRRNLEISRPFSSMKQVTGQSEKHNKIQSRKKRRGRRRGKKRCRRRTPKMTMAKRQP